MIERYTLPEMGHIWSLENKFDVWKEIEVLACEAQAELGQCGITAEEAAWIRAHADFTVPEIDEIEKVTNHDVIAFTTVMANYIDADVPEGEPKPSRWVHYGMTSSDLGDTALSYQVTQACDIIIDDIKRLGETCKRRALELKDALCVGRTHGIHAEPMTFAPWPPPALFPARWAPTLPSIPLWKPTCARSWASRPTRCPPRCWPATATPR